MARRCIFRTDSDVVRSFGSISRTLTLTRFDPGGNNQSDWSNGKPPMTAEEIKKEAEEKCITELFEEKTN